MIISLMMNEFLLVNITKDTLPNEWQVVNDVVMGGVSESNFFINDDGHGIFEGEVSLENNGGFCSVKKDFKEINVKEFTKMILHLKGDGKRYQCRIKTFQSDRHSYAKYFETNSEWQEIIIPLEEMYPTFRGQNLSMSNYEPFIISELRFLIGNKKSESFRLEIDRITLI